MVGAALRATATTYGPEDEAMLLRAGVLSTALAVVSAPPGPGGAAAAAFPDAVAVLARALPQLLAPAAAARGDGGGAAARAVEVLIAAARVSLVAPPPELADDDAAADPAVPSIAWLLPRGAPPLVLVGSGSGGEEEAPCIVAPHPALHAAGFCFGVALYTPTGVKTVT